MLFRSVFDDPDGGETKVEKGPVADIEEKIAQEGRRIIIAFGSDAAKDAGVKAARAALVKFLKKQKAIVSILEVPVGPCESRQDLGQWIAAAGADVVGEAVQKLLDAERKFWTVLREQNLQHQRQMSAWVAVVAHRPHPRAEVGKGDLKTFAIRRRKRVDLLLGGAAQAHRDGLAVLPMEMDPARAVLPWVGSLGDLRGEVLHRGGRLGRRWTRSLLLESVRSSA